MRFLLGDPVSLWVAVLVLVLPAAIIASGELQERLRQRDSLLERAVATTRNWFLPFLGVWVLVLFVFELDPAHPVARLAGTGLVLSATVIALQVVRYGVVLARERSRMPGRRSLPQLIFLLPRMLVLLVGGWLLFVYVWGVDVTGLLAALGVSSLVISVALQDTLSGLASGFLLLGDRPFNPGDWIRVDDLEGQVVDVNWRSSRIRDRNGDVLVIPNANLSKATVVNFHEPTTLHRVVVSLQVAYSNPPSRAKEMLLAAARATEGVLEDPPPQIRVVQIDDPLMGYEADLWIDDYAIAPQVRSDFGALVWYLSHRMDVPLPSPAFDLYHHDPVQEAADALPTFDQLERWIRRTPQFMELPPADVEELARGSRLARYRAGEVIIEPGEFSRDLYLLIEGRARLAIEEEVGAVTLVSGDVFGLLGQAGSEVGEPFVRAITDCEVMIIEAEAAGAVSSRNPVVTDSLNQLMMWRRRRLLPAEIDEMAPVREPDRGPGT